MCVGCFVFFFFLVAIVTIKFSNNRREHLRTDTVTSNQKPTLKKDLVGLVFCNRTLVLSQIT